MEHSISAHLSHLLDWRGMCMKCFSKDSDILKDPCPDKQSSTQSHDLRKNFD